MINTLKKIAFVFVCFFLFPLRVSGQWEILTDLPTPRTGVCGFAYQQKLYVIGGRDAADSVRSIVDVYDTVEDKWESIFPSLKTARENASAAVFDNAFWVIGGRDSNGSILNSVERFPIDGDEWTASDPLTIRREGHSAFINGTRLFVAGGFGGNEDNPTFLSSIESSQPAQYDWQVEENIELNLARRALASVVMADTTYMIGGFGSIGLLGVVEIYHPAIGVQFRQNLRTPRGGLSASVGQNGRIYVIGGRGQDNRPVALVETLDNAIGLWEFDGSVNFPRSDALALSSEEYIYLLGGKDDDNSPVSKVERLGQGITSVAETPALPTDYSLAQNYPNPFNPETSISFSLPTGISGKTTLTIYNIMGHVVRVLVNAELHGGHHQSIWNGRDADGMAVAGGLYICVLKNPALPAISRKMILVR